MKNLFVCLAATAATLLVPATVRAQSPTPAAVYAGPRFPGGPDSLRALVFRSISLTAPAPMGRVLVQFELKANGQPHNFGMLRPAAPVSKAFMKATATALNYLEARMPAWQPGPPASKASPDREPRISLLLELPSPSASQPYNYADQSPNFATVVDVTRAAYVKFKGRPMNDAELQASLAFGCSAEGLTRYIQQQVRYPSEALRNQQEGQVYAYFEVAENGAIEHPEILGTAGNALDAEVMRVVRNLPSATTPALLQGRPVRVYYSLPITFKIQ